MTKKINKVRNLEDYSLICPKEFNRKYKKNVRNLIGYMLYCQNMYSDQVLNNDGWFFVPLRRIMGATGIGSFTTAVLWLGKLSMDGIIETKKCYSFDPETGEKSTQKNTANCYRFSDALRTSLPDSYVKKCSTDILEDEDDNEKSVALNFKNKCSIESGTVIDTEIETDIYKCLYKSNSNLNNSNVMKTEQLSTVSDCHQEESKGLDNVTSLRSVTDSLQSSLGSSNLGETEHSSEVKDAEVNSLTTVTGEAPSMEEGFKHFFTSTYGRGYNEKLIANFANADDQYAFLWEKWNTFLKKFPDSDISFGTAEDNLKTFLWMLGKIYKTPSKLKERKAIMVHNFKSLYKHFFLIRWKAFLKEVDVLTAQDCRKTRLAFYDKVVSVYEDDEEREKTLSQMGVEYAVAYQATDKWSNPKPEELDPDLMYQNLSDGEVEETEVFSETQVTGETDGDTSNRVYDKWYGVWRKLLKEVFDSNGKLTIDEHTAVAIMDKAEADELPYGWRQKLKEAMEEDLERFSRKTCVSDPVSNE